MLNVVSTISYRSMELSQVLRKAPAPRVSWLRIGERSGLPSGGAARLAGIVMVGLALMIATFASVAARAQSAEPAFAVLVFSKTAGYRHDSIPSGIAAIRALGEQNDFRVDAGEDAAIFNDENLAQYGVVVFLNTTGPKGDVSKRFVPWRFIDVPFVSSNMLRRVVSSIT